MLMIVLHHSSFPFLFQNSKALPPVQRCPAAKIGSYNNIIFSLLGTKDKRQYAWREQVRYLYTLLWEPNREMHCFMTHTACGIIATTMKKQTRSLEQPFEVWHFITPEQIGEGYLHPEKAIARWLNNHESYIKVAEVQASSLDDVWGITQNVNDSWTKSPGVVWSKSQEVRSTSVGDVIVQNGKAYLVAWVGFIAIAERRAKFPQDGVVG